MDIKIFGVGCTRHEDMEKATRRALEELGVNHRVVSVTRVEDIIRQGVIITPTLMINGKVKAAGQVPPPGEMKSLFS